MPPQNPVLILGAGVNGACTARELILNGVPVWIVDKFDIAYGATAKSSRLIHGGLRYLEYGDTALVHESLDERARLLKLAPQFVKAVKLYIPIRQRFGGLLSAGLKFTRLTRTGLGAAAAKALGGERGLETVRMGLRMYDFLSRGGGLPSHSVVRVGEAGPKVDSNKYRWLAAYYDAQMLWPERFTLAVLEDARREAEQKGLEFKVLTHHHARLVDGTVEIRPTDASNDSPAGLTIKPSTIVNATGAWGDHTLRDLPAPTKRLFGGTKGSHIFTHQPALVRALNSEAVYAEADDGRLVFILPFEDSVLIGTTDERFDSTPDQAVSSEEEVAYLVEMVNEVFPDVKLMVADVDAHYSGVRPLPYQAEGTTGSIPRGHWIESTATDGIPIDTLIGGKLTTCRALGEETANRILTRLFVARSVSTQERPVPGSDGLSQDTALNDQFWQSVAAATGFEIETVMACGKLVGSRVREVLGGLTESAERELVAGTRFPRGFVRHIIETEWVEELGDLVERRLMLTDHRALPEVTLRELASFFPDADTEASVRDVGQRLRKYYGVTVERELAAAVS
ncbi:Aerobic glycerol-3-phosphate dehydrogenase [Caulifigura coniformis]|uniref:Aerobic glycerol-3-phosphate dehydrogenase n=1 Tax=Caulifigura coniformis TaxID=2527983 RepID=A0A517SJE9_9PLAN|nr:FAD-dependent oxidoreductase [Caulifigura coniformis]QDT56249.1 Aerobic glycerol-3-phosphate dehydrogenase [Caulifigura coniformis]